MNILRLLLLCVLNLSLWPVAQGQLPSSDPEPVAAQAGAVRIQCLYHRGYLYLEEGGDLCRYDAALPAEDPRGHWVLEPVADSDTVWIRNVKTGTALHIEDQTGWVQAGTPKQVLRSYRWRVVPKQDHVHLESGWISGTGMSLEDQETDKVGMARLNDEWWSIRFRIIPVEP